MTVFLDGRVTLLCAHCGGEFRRHPSRLKHGRGRHCSPACQYASRRLMPKTGVVRKCLGCGAEFVVARSRITTEGGRGKFCTRKCRDENWKGPLNPMFQDGSGVYKRGPHWHSTRRRILKRDNYECQMCGERGHLHVHHIIPFRLFVDPDEANQDDNLITLCAEHHRRVDAEYRWRMDPTNGAVFQLPGAGAFWKFSEVAA